MCTRPGRRSQPLAPETLWSYGFRDLETISLRDKSGRHNVLDSILVIWQYWEIAKFRENLRSSLDFAERAIKHGALRVTPNRRDDSKILELMYRFGSGVGCVEAGDWSRSVSRILFDECPNELLSFLRECFCPDHIDECDCYCSERGCTAIALFAKGFIGATLHTLTGDWLHGRYLRPLVRFLSRFFRPDSATTHDCAQFFLRLLAFELIEQRHTCCRRDKYGKPRSTLDFEHIAEIHDEHSQALTRFEHLVSRIMSDYEAQRGWEDFAGFIDRTLILRIDEFFTNDELSISNDEHVKSLEELNINLAQA